MNTELMMKQVNKSQEDIKAIIEDLKKALEENKHNLKN